jgi:hypothetical protein
MREFHLSCHGQFASYYITSDINGGNTQLRVQYCQTHTTQTHRSIYEDHIFVDTEMDTAAAFDEYAWVLSKFKAALEAVTEKAEEATETQEES